MVVLISRSFQLALVLVQLYYFMRKKFREKLRRTAVCTSTTCTVVCAKVQLCTPLLCCCS